MSLKDRSSSVSTGVVLSVFCLLLYSAGFIRIELKLNDHDQRLVAVEEVISQLLKQKMADQASSAKVLARKTKNKDNNAKLDRFRRVISSPSSSSNDSAYIREVLEDMFTSSLKICQKRGNFNVCPRGRPGPPGRAGTQGDQGRRGRKGSQGVMGQPGRSGKQGIMGPPGIRGEKGIKGDTGAPGIPGIKGEPGESISAPLATVSPSKLTVNESNTASLLCSVSGNPAAQVTWSRLNGSLPSNRTKVTSEGLMQIVDVRLEDTGKYKCVAQNILGKDEKVANLVVQSQPKVSLSFGPSYIEKDKNITLPECHVTSFPPAVITWSKVHDELVQARAVLKNGQLSILNAQRKDSGLYKCKASNILGQDSAVSQLNVVELPRFTVSPPAQLVVGKNQNITVPCQATGDPQPTITWMKENGELPFGRSKVSVDGTLHIWNLNEEVSGRYTCIASSAMVFKGFSAMKLTVKKVCGTVGVADRNIISDSRMTASSFHPNYYPYYGRLHESRGKGAWCAKTTGDRTDYLQVDMGVARSVCAVATQGFSQARTTSYKLQLSMDGVTWNVYNEGQLARVFPGNTDQNSIVRTPLSTYVRARFVRFFPIAYYSHPCLRVEIFVRK